MLIKRLLVGSIVGATLGAMVGLAFLGGAGTTTSTEVTLTSPQVTVKTPVNDPVMTDGVKTQRLFVDGSNSVRMVGPVTDMSVAATINALENLREMGATEVFLLIDSPGGSVLDGARLVSYIQASPVKVNTVCIAICASMAAHIHQVGAIRYVMPKSVLMFHPASGGAGGTIEQMLSQIRTIKLYVDRMDKYIADRAKIDYAKFKQELSEELWIEGVDALQRGFADKAAVVFGSEPVPIPEFLLPEGRINKFNVTM